MSGIDPELLTRIQKRDELAFTRVVRLLEDRLLNTAYRVLGNQSDAEEARQNVFLKLWKNPEAIPESADLERWLYRCIVNESVSLLRQRKKIESLTPDSQQRIVADAPHGNSPEAIQNLTEAIQQLKPEDRGLLSLRFDERMTIRQIAKIVNRPSSSVQDHLMRAIECLRCELKYEFSKKGQP